MSLLSHRPGGTQYLFSHRYAKLPTASATLSPSNENTVLTSLMQALLGQNGIFLACPLDKVGVEAICRNAVREWLAPSVQTVIANDI